MEVMACLPANVGDWAEKSAGQGCGSGRRMEGHHDPHGVLSAAGRGVAEISGGIPEAEPGISLFGGGASLASETRTQTHTGPQIGKAPPPGNPMRRFQLPLLGSNQDSPDPEPEPTGRRFRATVGFSTTYEHRLPAQCKRFAPY
jgi:hypothetical protein